MLMMRIKVPMSTVHAFMYGVKSRESFHQHQAWEIYVSKHMRLRPFVCSKIHASWGPSRSLYYTGARAASASSSKLLKYQSSVGCERLQLWLRAGGGQGSERGYTATTRRLSATARSRSHHRRVFAGWATWRRFHDAGALELEFALELVIHKGDVILDVLKVGHLCDTLLHHLLLLPDICIKSGSSLQNAILAFSIQRLVTGLNRSLWILSVHKCDAPWHPCVHWGRQRYRVLLENMKTMEHFRTAKKIILLLSFQDATQEAEEITCWHDRIFAIAIKPVIRQVIECKGPHLVA